MSQSLLNRNIVLKKQGLVAEGINIDQIRDTLQTRFTNSKPLTNQLPGIVIIHLPDKQFSITVQYETIVISDDLQGGEGNLEELVRSAININDAFSEALTAYGVNFRYAVEEGEGSKLEGFINTSELQTKGVVESAEAVKVVSLSFIEKKDDGLEQIAINNLMSRGGEYSGNIEFNYNCHKETEDIALPEFKDLKKMLEDTQTKSGETINKMLS